VQLQENVEAEKGSEKKEKKEVIGRPMGERSLKKTQHTVSNGLQNLPNLPRPGKRPRPPTMEKKKKASKKSWTKGSARRKIRSRLEIGLKATKERQDSREI